ncbi:MAG: ABC transporter permease [Phycisphaeraceae bacterium]|nr:MAG: ABC transporter permease [Phycisphaeraceae bacterium]
MLAALYRHRVYIARTAWRDVRHRHVGSAAGAAWNILRPVALIAVFTIVFGQVMTGRDGGGFTGIHFTLYLCAALLPWTAFSEAVSRGTHALVGGAAYLRKLAIDEEVYVAQSVLSAGISLVISMVLLLGLALVLGHGPFVTWLLLPLPLALLLLFGMGLGMALGTVFVFVRDVRQIVEIALLIGFWTVPIVYDPRIVPEWFRATFPFNPVYPFLHAVRDLFLAGTLPTLGTWALMLLWTVASIAFGQMVLERLRPEIRDNL